MTYQLKPCPFCGSNKIELQDWRTGFVVYCDECGVEMILKDTATKAAENWNTRNHAWEDELMLDKIFMLTEMDKINDALLRLFNENEELREAHEAALGLFAKSSDKCAALNAEIDRLRKGLEIYSKHRNWEKHIDHIRDYALAVLKEDNR